MTIAARLKGNALLFAGMVLVISLVFAAALEMQREAFERSLVADKLTRGAYDLNSLSNRYLRYPEERPREQWMLAYEALAGTLERETLKSHGRHDIIVRMSRTLDDMSVLFGDLVAMEGERGARAAIPGAADERRRGLLADLIIKRSRELSLDAVRLATLNNEEIARINRRIVVFIPVVALVLTAVTWWTSARISRSITGPIGKLREGVETIGTGNLHFRVGRVSDDELGKLSDAFDHMTERLETTTVSLDELAREVAERKRTEEQLKRLSYQNKLILESAGEGIWGMDTQGTVTFINRAAAAMLGYETNELVGKQSHQQWHHTRPGGAPYPSEECPIYATYKDGTDHSGEEVFWRKDGSGVTVDFTSKPLVEEGLIVGAVVTFKDITERKRAEEALRLSEQRLRAIFDNAGVGIVEVETEEDRLIAVNDHLCAILGYRREELLGTTIHELTFPGDRDLSDRINEQLRRGNYSRLDYEKRYLRRDGSPLWVHVTVSAVRDAEGRHLRSIGTVKDISERKRAEEERERLLGDLQRSNKELEQFAYVASHDLQEPLRMVASYVQLLEKKYRGKLDTQADKYIHFAADGALRMQKLIEGLLAYSRITRKGAAFGPVDTNTVFSQAVKNLTAAVQESHAEVTKDDLPIVSGDELQLVQLFQNLIGNAIKYRKPDTPPAVHVSARKEGREWVFSVRDNGIGISPEYHDRIFLLFQRLHSREEYPGTGIGLALCKRIVERHHGRIWVESAPGEGATFFFTIPERRSKK
ncbi:MAG: PAS domain S-box protein [Nitrospirota bacterium]